MTSLAESEGRGRLGTRLVWIALALSLTLNVFFIGGAIWSRMEAAQMATTPAQRFLRLGDQLNLTGPQRAAFEQFITDVREHIRILRQGNGPLLESAWKELAKPQPDQAKVNHLVEQATENRHAYQTQMAESLMTLMKALTPEQRAQFAALATARHDPLARRLWQMIAP